MAAAAAQSLVFGSALVSHLPRPRFGVGCVCDWVALWQVQIVEYIERLKDLAAISCSARAG